MKLMTSELANRFKLLGDQDISDPIVAAKYFTPWTNWTWYLISYEPEDRICFGYVCGHEKELGYFSLDELETIKGPVGLKIERDLYFKEKRLSEVKKSI